MPHKSLLAIRRDLHRRIGTERYVDACLSVVSYDGVELFRVGGRWDTILLRYAGPCEPHVVRLEESQTEVGKAIAEWLDATSRGDKARPIVFMLAGDRGSGKTWFLGLLFIVVALAFPREWQFGVNITSSQRRECVEAITEIARDDWIAEQSDNVTNPFTSFVTDSRVVWTSARNPSRLRQAKLRIRHVAINEGSEQPEKVYLNAVGATRNVDGLTTIATNRPQTEAADWVSVVADAIEGEEMAGRLFYLDPRKNRTVDAEALDKRAKATRVVSREAAEADSGGGLMKVSGPLAFPAFRALPREKGGHVGDPPPRPQVGAPLWRDVTRELSAAVVPESAGWDYVIGVDWQTRPGIIGIVSKLFRADDGRTVLWCCDCVATAGEETAFSAALFRRGYSPHGGVFDGRRSFSALIVADGTGARQNAAHNWEQPPSFVPMSNDGWLCVPPTYTRNGKPDNPLVKESRAQMHAVLSAHQILISPKLKEPEEGFASLVESMRRAKVTPRGGLVEKGGWQHACDDVRYLAWKFLPRPQPPRGPEGMDDTTADEIRSIRVLTNG
jgi:hypothetical protein